MILKGLSLEGIICCGEIHKPPTLGEKFLALNYSPNSFLLQWTGKWYKETSGNKILQILQNLPKIHLHYQGLFKTSLLSWEGLMAIHKLRIKEYFVKWIYGGSHLSLHLWQINTSKSLPPKAALLPTQNLS